MTPFVAPNREPCLLDFRAIYDRYFFEVSRWVRVLGGPASDRDDLVQDVFVTVHRRLSDFDGQNVPGWLYQIARRRVRDHRRLFWVRHRPTCISSIPECWYAENASPSEILDTERKRALLERLLRQLNESERTALILFEVDGYRGEQIAELQGVQISTAWARIHRARLKLRASLARVERCGTRASAHG